MNTFQKFGSVFIICTLQSLSSFGQNSTSNVQDLLSQRMALSSQNLNYADVEKEIVALGELPPALVTKSINDGKTTFEFTTYKDIRPESESRIEGRIMVSIHGVESIEINDRNIAITFTSLASENDMNDFFKLMGYNAYVLKTN